MKLSQWAKKQGISYMTAFRWFHKGLIPNATQFPNGTIIIQETQPNTNNKNEEITIYCRVSSYEKKMTSKDKHKDALTFASQMVT